MSNGKKPEFTRGVETVTLGSMVEDCGAFDRDSLLCIEKYGFEGDAIPLVSFVIPVHNQGTRIVRNLESIVRTSALSHEFVIVLDGCSDESESDVRSWATVVTAASSTAPTQTRGVTLVTSRVSVFETMSDMIGIFQSSSEFVIEIQADMQLVTPRFDHIMVESLIANPSLFLLSGRGAHDLPIPGQELSREDLLLVSVKRFARRFFGWLARKRGWYRSSRLEFMLSDSVGRVGRLIELPLRRDARERIYLHQTVMRGPLAFAKSKFVSLGGFDTRHFFLGDDDHDLALRAWSKKSWRSGYVPIDFISPLDAGSTRAVRSAADTERFNALKSHYDSARALSFLATDAAAIRGANKAIRSVG